MVEVTRNWMVLLLFVAAAASALAQSPPEPGSLAGKLTDLRSAPLAGATVILRNDSTGAEFRTVTARNGAYRFTGLTPGQYTIQAETPQLGRGSLDGIEVNAGAEARVQAAMQFELPAPEPVPMVANAAPAPAPPVSPVLPASPAPPLASAASSQPAPQMALQGRPAPSAFREPPAALSATPAAAVAAEPLHPLPVTALPAPNSATVAAFAPPAPAPPPSPTRLPAPGQAAARNPAIRLAPPAEQTQVARAAPPAILPTSSVPSMLAEIREAGVMSRGLAVSEIAAAGLRAVLAFTQPLAPLIVAAAQQPAPAAEAVTTTMTADELQSLPVTGRHWQDFLLDTPTASTQSGGASAASLRGSLDQPPDTSIDGMSTELAFGATRTGNRESISEGLTGDEPSNMGQAWGGRGAGVSRSAIRQVQTVAGNVAADDSRSAGGRIDIETQRGTNQLHGQGSFFDRQNNWGARNPFTQWFQFTGFSGGPSEGYTSNFTSPSYTPPDHETVWGLGAGSRIRRDKLFWFGAIDSYRRNDPGLAMAKEPIGTDETAGTSGYGNCYGFFCPPSEAQTVLLCAQLGLSAAAPQGSGLPSSCPVAMATAEYSGVLQNLAGLLGPAPRTSAQWVGFARIDWQAAERHHFTFEGIGADWNAPGGGMTRTAETYGSHSFGSSEASQEWLLARWEAFLTPNLLATTQGSVGRSILSARPDSPSAFEQAFLTGNAWGQLPQIAVDSANGFTIGNPSRFGQGSYPDERQYNGREMLDWVHNGLLLKAGFELGHDADSTSLLRNQTGTYHYSTVANFISDALSFEKYGLSDALDADNPHNCDETRKLWYTSNGTPMGLGNLPCYSSYSQTMGPTNWHLSTNDLAGFSTAQWQPNHRLVLSIGLRWSREQLPPPIAALANPALPFTGKLPNLGNNWGPRVSLAIGSAESHWPVLRLGYGLYYGRVENATLENVLTRTGSPAGDLSFFMRPTDDLPNNGGGAPPFPYVLSGEPLTVVTPGAVEFAPNFRNPEIHQALAAIEESLPGRVQLTASAVVSLGRRLPSDLDANLTTPTQTPAQEQTITYDVCDEVPYTPPGTTSSGQPTNSSGTCGNLGLGPIKAAQITVPYYASWPSDACSTWPPPPDTTCGGWNNASYQGITEMMSRANSTYEATVVRLTRYGRRGLTFHANYTYAHAMDWNPNASPLDPAPVPAGSDSFRQEYGTSRLDVRHFAAVMLVYEPPWKLHDFAGRIVNGWMLSGIGNFHSGLPYTMRTSGSLAE